jgi:hypothetical protein
MLFAFAWRKDQRSYISLSRKTVDIRRKTTILQRGNEKTVGACRKNLEAVGIDQFRLGRSLGHNIERTAAEGGFPCGCGASKSFVHFRFAQKTVKKLNNATENR